MVATLLALRLRVLVNSLKRSTWQLVGAIIGAVYAVGVLVFLVAGLVALGVAGDTTLIGTILVLAGSALLLGWVLLPLLLTGIDQTLEPARLAQFPIPLNTLLVALTVAGVLGVPGIVTALAALATAVAWLQHPAAAATAVVCAAVAVVTAVVASRAMTAFSVGMQSNRRWREASGILFLIPLFFLGPIILGVTMSVRESIDALPSIATALGWSPLGAVWAVPVAVAVGDLGGAALRLLIALATLAVLVAAWRFALARALVSPAAPTASRSGARRTIGIFAMVPQTPAGAVAARCLTYWRRDPRYLRQLIFVPLLPLLLWFYSVLSPDLHLVVWSGPFVALTLALVLVSDISFDGTAFATHLVDGVRGRDDRVGRVAALASFAVPVTVVLVVGGVALTAQWQLLPVLLGLSLGMLLTGMGVSSISSARYVIPVPAAGDNPFKAAQGQTFTTGLQGLVVMSVVLALMIPTGALVGLFFLFGIAAFGWAALATGVVLGTTVLIVGVRTGGALLDRTGPSLLASLRKLQGA